MFSIRIMVKLEFCTCSIFQMFIIWTVRVFIRFFVKLKIQFIKLKSSHSGIVPEDSGSQYKISVLYLSGGLMVIQENSEHFNSLIPILLELCKKKLQRGQLDSRPPGGIGFKSSFHKFSYSSTIKTYDVNLLYTKLFGLTEFVA